MPRSPPLVTPWTRRRRARRSGRPNGSPTGTSGSVSRHARIAGRNGTGDCPGRRLHGHRARRRCPVTDALSPALDRVLRLASDLAGAWGARARVSTTVARERAILRLFGVTGLDHSGVPLASAVVERAMGEDPVRLGSGIALPFAVALLEYDIAPQQLALDVANGAIDLGFEAQLLADPERRAAAEAEVRRLAALAVDRIDANRTARRETLAV